MHTKKTILFIFTNLFMLSVISGQNKNAPSQLTVNLLSHTERVYLNGYPTTASLEEAIVQKENFQYTTISTSQPVFGWTIPSTEKNRGQTAYRILVSTQKEILQKDSADLWDSGKTKGDSPINIRYNGKPLTAGNIVFWKIKIWDEQDNESDFSPISAFATAKTLLDYTTDRYPLRKQDEHPVLISRSNKNTHFVDFGKASFGRVRINLYSENGTDSVTLHLGEVANDLQVNRSPGGTIRYGQYKIALAQGWNTYVVTIRRDPRNTGSQAVLMPEYIGEVTPFRYCEIEDYQHPLLENEIIRETVFYPFNDSDSHFHSSDSILNQVWDISKYSIKATSFAGVYVDGDRERIPYEADALINQLSHYCVARDYSMARYTHEYLIKRPTWPTEWILQSVLIAWEDYMYTGNTLSLSHYYEDLKAKTLIALADENGFISTRTGKVTPEVLHAIHFSGQLRDIVDWPHTGILGLEKEEGGETDGFVFTDVNTVVNAFHYRALTLMSKMAETLGKKSDKQFYTKRAELLKQSFNKHLLDKKRGIYVDGIGTEHASLHANMFPLAFGLVPEKFTDSVVRFIRSRGMACSVYGSQFLVDGLYDAGDADYALQLLTSTGERSWYNMIRAGSTITMEAWDNKYKPNQDWNHAWGAAPANLIPRKLMGIEPIEPGFSKIRIKPQPGSLKFAEIKHPSIRGDIFTRFSQDLGQSFQLQTTIPPNITAEIYLPYYGSKQSVSLNGNPLKFNREGNFTVLKDIPAGEWDIVVSRLQN